MIRQGSILLAIAIAVGYPTEVMANWLCRNIGFCQQQSPSHSDHVSVTDVDDSVIANKTRAAKNMNNYFKFYTFTDKAPQAGYVRVEYAFLGEEDGDNTSTFYDNSDQKAREFLERSIIDWARSLFVSSNQTYVVTLSAKSTSSNEVFWIKPIFSFEYKDGFSLINDRDEISFNGSSTFYKPVTDEIEVSIEVKHVNSANIDTSFVKDSFDTAKALGGAFGGPVFSVANVLASPAYKQNLDRIEDKLRKFESVKTLSRHVTLKYAEGRRIGFLYHFLAPTLKRTPPFKLSVNLSFVPSLLEQYVILGSESEKNALASGNVMTLPVQPLHGTGTKPLKEYVKGHAINDGLDVLLNDGKLLKACENVRSSLSEIFQPADIALAQLAYISENRAAIGQNSEPLCFAAVERLYLAKYNLSLPQGFDEADSRTQSGTPRSLRPVQKYFGTYMEALAIALKVTEAQIEWAGSSLRILREQGRPAEGERAVKLTDDTGMISSTSPRQIFPTDLIEKITRVKARRAGCFERTIYSNEETDPNTIGMILEKGDKLYEAVVHFDQTPKSDIVPAEIEVDAIEFRPLSAEALGKYRTEYGGASCQSGWSPWQPKEASPRPS